MASVEWTLNDATGSMNNYSFTAGYDDGVRLIDWDRSNGDTQDWTLSKVGDWSSFNENGTAVARTHNDVHELTAIGANSLTYDVKGNLLTDTDNHTYEYDALGRRVAKQVSDECGMTTVVTRTTYINNFQLLPPLSSIGGQVLAEYEKVDTGSVTLARTYTYGEYIDDPLSITDHSGTPTSWQAVECEEDSSSEPPTPKEKAQLQRRTFTQTISERPSFTPWESTITKSITPAPVARSASFRMVA